MNTTIGTVGLPGHVERQVESWFSYVEGKLSRFLPDSELSRLNHSNGLSFSSSALLSQVLASASSLYKETDGLFNPYLGTTLSGLGYDRSFDQLSTVKECMSVNEPAPSKLREQIIEPMAMNPFMPCITLLPGVSVDLGGIAKGWSAQMMRSWLRDDGVMSGLIDAGGDIVVWGEAGQSGWDLVIADPFYPEQNIVILKLKREAAIATSSTLKRRWTDRYNRLCHHIIDPATRQPSQSDLVQATILADDLTVAEVYAKCLLILGSEKGMAWLRERKPDLGIIGVRSDGSVVTGPSLYPYCLEWSVQN
ncbi:MAG TPA: FAD:protein FMN transferase [Spirochaetia bacterium]|nr:FAD:protein FMN transferase [Spirochaetia bacterium]